MSLILRQHCQPILDQYGLGDYHTRINNLKYLSIVGPCGKPLFSISGIEFVRNQPSIKEINFATQLLEEFCLTHKQDIQNCLIDKQVLFSTSVPKIPEKCKWAEKSNCVIYTGISDISIYFYLDTKEFSIHTSGTSNINISNFIKATNAAAVKKYTKICKEQKAYADIRTKYDTAILKLQTCNI